jgi:hypothetical protein
MTTFSLDCPIKEFESIFERRYLLYFFMLENFLCAAYDPHLSSKGTCVQNWEKKFPITPCPSFGWPSRGTTIDTSNVALAHEKDDLELEN